ncbi:UDP-glycosyltransferase 73C2, partial [Mucuna pruriens]
MSSEAPNLNFVLFPLMSQGHMIPMVDIAKILAQQGVTVTVITTHHNVSRLTATLGRSTDSGSEIRLVELQFPYQEAGLPEGCENLDMFPSLGTSLSFFNAANTLQEQVEKLFHELTPPPSCIISDMCLPYTANIATKFNVPRISFVGQSCFSLFCLYNLGIHKVLSGITSETEYFVLPGLPDKVEMTKAQLPARKSSEEWREFYARTAAAEGVSSGVVMNSFEELEPAYARGYKKAINGRVWCIGPVSLCNKDQLDKAERGNKASIDEHYCMKWLNLQKPKSVIYVCLGSMCNITTLQLIELGLALEASNRPFIWVIRESQLEALEKWIEEDGFEEKTKARSLVIRGWAPQVLILSHPAIGGFLTHCGWNSTLEAICAGVPMVTWPLFGDQFLNEKLIVQILRVGVRVGVEVPVKWGEEEEKGLLVKKEEVEKAIGELMDETRESEEMRERVKELAEMAKRAVEEGGSSHSNATEEPAMETTPPAIAGCSLHFVFIPLMAAGHMLPLVDMAKLMARRNVKVTIVTTPLNALQFKASIDREIQSGSPIQTQLIRFPNAEAGIPEGYESADALPSMDLRENFHTALNMLQQQLEELLPKLNPFPCCIISDKNIPCVADISIKCKVPRIIFDGTNCLTLLCNHNLHASKVCENISDSDQFVFPGLPHRFEMRKSQLPVIFRPGTNQKLNALRERTRVSEVGAYGIVVNSFEELEAEYVKEYQRVTGLKVWCVGPVSLSNKDDLDKAKRGSKDTNADEIETNQYVKWLDSWPQSSVIYVGLGSLNRVTHKQLIEIGLGLEATKRPFIWVLRGAYMRDEMERWLLEERSEERVKERGILIRGWAPQVLILSHKAIGAFFTHCGWNSTLEAICVGVPLVTFPMFADQFYNEKFIVQVAEIGVRAGAEISIHYGDENKYSDCVQVNRDNVKEAIEKVLGEGEEKEKRRIIARKYADMAKKAIEEGGSSYHNMSMLIDDIMHVQLLNQS